MKKRIIIATSILLTMIMIGFVITIYQRIKNEQEKQALLLEMNNSYAPMVTLMKDKQVYIYQDGNYQAIGSISQGTILSLESKELKSIEDIYYQIKNSKYYIDYQDIKEVKDYQQNQEYNSYLVTTKIHTSPSTTLYQNDQPMISLEEKLTFDVLAKEENNYYVKFLDQIYVIKDHYEIETLETVDSLKDISVLNFSNDISLEQLNKVLSLLKEQNYETITIADFKRWIKGQVDFDKNKVLLLCYQELDTSKKEIAAKYSYTINTSLEDIEFTSGDTKLKVGDTKYYKYEIQNTTSLDRVKDMLNGIKEVTSLTSKVAVLNYHFFYDSSIGESCNESICIDVDNFRKQLDYLKENHYKILTMQEFNDWMDRKITLPEKSVLITIDDGAMGTSKINGNKIIPILEEYQIPATLFLITGWWDVQNYQSQYLEIYSHGDELHHDNYCNASGNCGYKGLVLSKEEIKTDLMISTQKIGNHFAFCYPFYQYNQNMIDALKETGFQLAFVGGNRKASQLDDKYKIPRYVVYKNTSLNGFISMVK